MRDAAWLAPLGAALLLIGCEYRERDPGSENRAIELAGASSARVDVEMTAGELRIHPGGGNLLDAEFRYDHPQWKPVVKYDVSGGRGFLSVRQPPMRAFGGDNKNRWELRLNDRVPMELRVHLGAGESKIALGGTNIRRLEIGIGAGEVEVDLNGLWEEDLEARISGGVGEATVRLPGEAGVRVKASGGIGGISARNLQERDGYYVNDAWGKSKAQLRIEVKGGIGQINLVGAG
jgi:hypothetical protein